MGFLKIGQLKWENRYIWSDVLWPMWSGAVNSQTRV